MVCFQRLKIVEIASVCSMSEMLNPDLCATESHVLDVDSGLRSGGPKGIIPQTLIMLLTGDNLEAETFPGMRFIQ